MSTKCGPNWRRLSYVERVLCDVCNGEATHEVDGSALCPDHAAEAMAR